MAVTIPEVFEWMEKYETVDELIFQLQTRNIKGSGGDIFTYICDFWGTNPSNVTIDGYKIIYGNTQWFTTRAVGQLFKMFKIGQLPELDQDQKVF